MQNLSRLFQKIDEQKPLVQPSRKWPWTGRKKFSMGKYRIRFVSNDEKCPDGFRIYTVHELQKEVVDNKWDLSLDEKEKAYYHIMCTESYKGYKEVKDEDGNVISKLAVPCPTCDFHQDAIETYVDDDLDEDILKALDEMSSNSCRSFLYPALVYATETEVTDDDGKKKKLYVPDNRNCVGVILKLYAKNYEGNADLTLIKLLHEQVFNEQAEDTLSARRGRWFNWEKKSNGQTLSPDGGREPLTDKEAEIVAKMPNIATFGMGVGDSKFVKNYKVGYEKGMQMARQSWFGKLLEKHHDYRFDDIQRGLV